MSFYNKNVMKDLDPINKSSYFNEWYSIVSEILLNEEFQKRKLFLHHEDSVWHHSIDVSFRSFLVAKFYNLDYRCAAIGGLLHDFYPYAWRYSKELENLDKKYLERYFKKHKGFKNLHGFVHAKEAAINAKKYFPNLVDDKVYNCIYSHMFPLNLRPPQYPEGWVISSMDKRSSITVLKNVKDLPNYVGIKTGQFREKM